MYKDLTRAYKVVGAEETVSRITGKLDQIGLKTKPVAVFNPYNGISSLSIYVENLGRTAHGKGMNEEYALASGYAEFMERIQNDAIRFLGAERLKPYERLRNQFGYVYYPDEKVISKAEFECIIEEISAVNFLHNEKERTHFEDAALLYKNRISAGSYESIAVPFLDTQKGATVYIPVQFLVNVSGSNGMCAGNVPEEALCQGLFEIIERYAARKVFLERLTPPTVPDEYLSQFDDQLSILKEIYAKEKIEISVKDFSCGLGLPAVGILMIDRQANTYHVHCAGETSFSVGLHRCLTETYQNTQTAKLRLRNPIPEKEYDYMLKEDPDSYFLKYKNWIDWMKYGYGAFPKSVLEAAPSYAFDPTAFQTERDYTAELKKLLHLFRNLGYNVYIRDNSFLGFPSYMVYIPMVSHDADDIYGSITYYSRQKAFDVPGALNGGDPHEVKNLLHEIQLQLEDDSVSAFYYFNLIKLSKTVLFIEDNTSFLQAMLLYYFGDYRKCLEHLAGLYQKFSSGTLRILKLGHKMSDVRFHDLPVDQADPFFRILIDYVSCQLSGADGGIEKILLSKGHAAALVFKAMEMFADKNRLLKQINVFPVCPRCDECKLFEVCGIKNAPDIVARILSHYDKSNLTDMRFLSGN